MDYYRDTLVDIEKIISDSTILGPVVVAGDFNAHLGKLWRPCASSTANCQGLLLGELLNRCELHATSLSSTTSGQEYTFHSGDRFTTVDYILTDVEASSCVDQCWTHEDNELNQSDHLPLSAKLSCGVPTQQEHDSNWIKIDWSKAEKSGVLTSFQDVLKDRLSPSIGTARCDVGQLDDEIKNVASLIKEAAETMLPRSRVKKVNRFKDKTLFQLCAKSKTAWEVWRDGGRPNEGPLYKAKCFTRKEVKKRIKLCSAMEERKKVQRREHLFRMNAHSRFKLPQKREKSQCTRLRVEGRLISEPMQLLEAWTSHFEKLAQSQISMHTGLQDLQQKLLMLASSSFQ